MQHSMVGSMLSGTMGGACGYGNPFTDGYRTNTAAVTTVAACDAENAPQWCLKGESITITPTNVCPPKRQWWLV
ncbi:hypothetical protein V6N11_006843 [Hibiscus sabdariffa]|uniref:Expansin n=1 Tax=Hibiscus sabdariffa TaxID=183260 RepID=A0ABR2RSA5_9ROSI